MENEPRREHNLTSPRLWGEVAAKRRVRGSLGVLFSFRISGDSPSPQPSPRKRGERENN
jgi:hypothetical protein